MLAVMDAQVLSRERSKSRVLPAAISRSLMRLERRSGWNQGAAIGEASCESGGMIPTPAEPNEDPEFDPEELIESTESPRADAAPPEVNPATEQLTEWDLPPSSSGKSAPKVMPEDEVSTAEKLVRDGMDEAERERRIAAADPDPEP